MSTAADKLKNNFIAALALALSVIGGAIAYFGVDRLNDRLGAAESRVTVVELRVGPLENTLRDIEIKLDHVTREVNELDAIRDDIVRAIKRATR